MRVSRVVEALTGAVSFGWGRTLCVVFTDAGRGAVTSVW